MKKDIYPGDTGVSLARGHNDDIISCVINGVVTNAFAKEDVAKHIGITVVPGGTTDEPYVVQTSIEINKAILPILQGVKTNVSTTATQLSKTSVRIYKAMTIKVRSLGTGAYIAIGNSAGQEYRLTGAGDTKEIDFVDNLTDLYVITDTGTTGAIEWFGA